jgi:IS30 family transposase
VIGKREKSKVLLTLTERLNKKQIIVLMVSKTSNEVVKSLDNIEQEMGWENFRKLFKSIT